MSTRAFTYCESTEGGMSAFDCADGELPTSLSGWMSKDCLTEDEKLVAWMQTATLGQRTAHRLGMMFCVVSTAPAVPAQISKAELEEIYSLAHLLEHKGGIRGKQFMPVKIEGKNFEFRFSVDRGEDYEIEMMLHVPGARYSDWNAVVAMDGAYEIDPLTSHTRRRFGEKKPEDTVRLRACLDALRLRKKRRDARKAA